MSSREATEAYRAARDVLIRHRSDYHRAMDDFRWPDTGTFNWALDHFDDMARGNNRIALRIVDDSGADVARSFEALRVASDRAANYLRALGIRRGDRVLVMLPNRVELWEIMLAAIKLGAVLSPATMLLSEADLKDRIERGQMRAVIVDVSTLGRFAGLADACVRISVGGVVEGWSDYSRAAVGPAAFEPDGPTMADDPCVLYFTSGTTSKPKMV